MRRCVLALALCLTAMLALDAAAEARPWTTSYDWDGTGAGYDGWRSEESPSGDGQPGPFYNPFRGGAPEGPGLGIVPIGGRVYGNGDPARPDGGPSGRLVLDAPGASVISEIEFGAARFRNQSEGQVYRLRLGATPGPTDTRDFFPDNGYPQDVRHELGDVNLQLTPGGRRAEMGLLTTCSGRNTPMQPPFDCRYVDQPSQSFGHVGSARVTYDDPDAPLVEVASDPPVTAGYENRARPRTVTAAGEDPSSGIRRIRIELRTGTVRRTLTDRTVACDPEHASGDRGALECPIRAEASGRDDGRDSASTRDYIVTVTDRAGNETERTVTVRRDLVAPSSASASGELLGLTRTWTNRRGLVPVRLSATDALSGVGRLELRATPVSGGRPRTLGGLSPDCSRGCRAVSVPTQVDLDQITEDGRYRLRVVATDRAGNERSTAVPGILRVDRTAPRPTGGTLPRYAVRPDGSVRLTFRAGRDPSPGSGVRLFVFRYTVADPNPANQRLAFARFTARDLRIGEQEIRFRGTRSQSFIFRPEGRIDTSLDPALLTLDRAEGNDPPARVAGGEYGNVQESRAVIALRQSPAERIYREQNLRLLKQRSDAAGRTIRVRAPNTGRVFGNRLGKVGSLLGKASIVGFIVSFLSGAENTGCEAGEYSRFNPTAARTFNAAGRALQRAANASLGGADRARELVRSAIQRVRNLNQTAIGWRESTAGECQAPSITALRITEDLGPALKSAEVLSSRRRAQNTRREAYRVALDISRRTKYGLNRCNDAGTVAQRFGGPGRGKSNYAVYWSPPPQTGRVTRYVGISRALPSRCESYRRSSRLRARGIGLQTLNLPHLYLQEARDVEEALIAYFGPSNQDGCPDEGGQLDNCRHEIDPRRRPEYCARLLRGQYILLLNRYETYADARFTRGRSCPGAGGPR